MNAPLRAARPSMGQRVQKPRLRGEFRSMLSVFTWRFSRRLQQTPATVETSALLHCSCVTSLSAYSGRSMLCWARRVKTVYVFKEGSTVRMNFALVCEYFGCW